MIGMNNTITKNVMPFYICINNKYNRINEIKFTEDMLFYKKNFNQILDIIKKDNKELLKKAINNLPQRYIKFFNEIL